MLPLPPGPRYTWSLDLLVDLPTSHANVKHLVVAVDPFSKFVLLKPLADKRAETVAAFLRNTIISTFGPPAILATDNGNEFKQVVDEVASMFETLHIRSSPYHSEANGIAERYIQTIE